MCQIHNVDPDPYRYRQCGFRFGYKRAKSMRINEDPETTVTRSELTEKSTFKNIGPAFSNFSGRLIP